MSVYAEKIKKGKTYIVVKKSRPLFKISPFDEDSELWEPVVDFTKIKKSGVAINDLITRI